jgi:hypothetical protein
MHTCAHDKTSRPLWPFGASGICWMPCSRLATTARRSNEGRWESTHSHGAGRGDLIAPRLFNVVRTRLPAVGRRMSTPQLV